MGPHLIVAEVCRFSDPLINAIIKESVHKECAEHSSSQPGQAGTKKFSRKDAKIFHNFFNLSLCERSVFTRKDQAITPQGAL
jgi:hypothetical protein